MFYNIVTDWDRRITKPIQVGELRNIDIAGTSINMLSGNAITEYKSQISALGQGPVNLNSN